MLGQNSSKSRNKTSSLLGGRVLTDALRFYYAHHNVIDQFYKQLMSKKAKKVSRSNMKFGKFSGKIFDV